MAKHNLEEVRSEFNRLDRLCNIDSSGLDLRISCRGIRKYGCCKYKKTGRWGNVVPYAITFSDFLMDCEEQFWDTVRHEYAHALVAIRTGKAHGHDAIWKKACLEVGCRPERIANDPEAGKMSADRRAQKEKYEVRCLNCHRVWRYTRAGKVVRSLQKEVSCTCPCGSKKLILLYLNQ